MFDVSTYWTESVGCLLAIEVALSRQRSISKRMAMMGQKSSFPPGRDGFWLARWLRARGVEATVRQCSIRREVTLASVRSAAAQSL